MGRIEQRKGNCPVLIGSCLSLSSSPFLTIRIISEALGILLGKQYMSEFDFLLA